MPIAINIKPGSPVPKYRQLADAISNGIQRKLIRKEEQLPSINELSALYDISRDTAEKAYRLLKKQGVIKSVRGKGYYASTDAPLSGRSILLLFNKLSPYKEAIYNGFVRTVGRQASVDLQVYYEDLTRFEAILEEKAGAFSEYVIIPSFRGEAAIRAQLAIDKHLAGRNITLLGRPLPGLKEKHRAVIENFEDDIYGALGQARARLGAYDRVKLYFPFDCNLSRGIIRGFQRFCLEHSLNSEIIYKGFANRPVEPGVAYIVIRDEQLVTLVHQVKTSGLRCGHDVGILAYNDSPLKQVLLDGITVMTTRHEELGHRAACLILDNRWETVENEFVLVERGSL